MCIRDSPWRKLHDGVFHIALDVASAVGNGEQQARRAVSLDPQRERVLVIFQGGGHQNSAGHQAPQRRRDHRAGVMQPFHLRDDVGGCLLYTSRCV